MKRRLRSILTILLSAFLLLGFSISLAQSPNDPAVNPDANACYDGGSMDGTCTRDRDVNDDGVINELDTDYLFRCGWYKIRVKNDMMSESVLDKKCEFETPEPTPMPTSESDDDDDDDDNNGDDDPAEIEEPDFNPDDQNLD